MDLTEGNFEQKNARAKKMMLWFAMVSIAMMFAGLTSAYVVSKSRPDWLADFQIPSAFFYSTLAIVLSSASFHLARTNTRLVRSLPLSRLYQTFSLFNFA